ncbi:MAG: DUF4417 domain-containing protein [Rikenellaceae bacterium]|nr:DUF4417 domain-containing protein [Rikenellaceae bacterium]
MKNKDDHVGHSSGNLNLFANKVKRVKSQKDQYGLELLDGMSKAGPFDMPMLEPFTQSVSQKTDSLPLPFHEARSRYRKTGTLKGFFVHFYTDDYRFVCIKRNPGNYLALLRSADFVIGPDFSVYANYPFPVVLRNIYDSRVIARYLQMGGVKIIPNVVWINPQSYSYVFEGQPVGSVISVNSTCIPVRDKRAQTLWLHGYREAIDRLSPVSVLRYGRIIPGEEKVFPEAIHFFNPYLNYMRYGR